MKVKVINIDQHKGKIRLSMRAAGVPDELKEKQMRAATLIVVVATKHPQRLLKKRKRNSTTTEQTQISTQGI